MTGPTQITEDNLRESEIALIDALKAIMELMIGKGLATPDEFVRMFEHQLAGYIQKRQPLGGSVFALLIRFLTDKDRNKEREAIRQLLDRPTQGSA